MQDTWTIQNEASAAQRTLAFRVLHGLRRSCGRVSDNAHRGQSTRRGGCGVCGLFNDLLPFKVHVKEQS
jgi:hypothetical protein